MLVLASASKARQKLLDQIALSCKVIVSDFDETNVQELDPLINVRLLAKCKAETVFKNLIEGKKPLNNFQALLGCDSLFEFKGEVFAKPINKDQLINRWKRMSGQSGFLHTGHHLISIGNSKTDSRNNTPNECCEAVVSTKIEFISLSNSDIIKYASMPEPYNCAGGFAIEGKGGLFIKKSMGVLVMLWDLAYLG